MNEQWQELKETIIEMRDNDGTGTQQEVCKFLVNYMGVLEKQMVEPTDMKDTWSIKDVIDAFKRHGLIREQEPETDVLDKIRAEIEKQKEERCFDDDDMFAYRTGLDDALYIIDKYLAEYKAESEDKE